MIKIKSPNRELEDIAVQPPERDLDFALANVGLENVQTQVLWQGQRLPARAQAGVSLIDRASRGIHMSRLFKILSQLSDQELSWRWLSTCLESMLASHHTLSDGAEIKVAFDLPVLRRALVSHEEGWRIYPVIYQVSQTGNTQRVFKLTVKVLYSSTCPCSASLSRQAWKEQFSKDFNGAPVTQEKVLEWLGQHFVATPHAQRSEATCDLSFGSAEAVSNFSIVEWIDSVEQALGTPVQASVKREDEQEFARLNAKNLMFCEDAVRKLKAALIRRPELTDFQIEVRHFESLHPHDVVARVGKN